MLGINGGQKKSDMQKSKNKGRYVTLIRALKLLGVFTSTACCVIAFGYWQGSIYVQKVALGESLAQIGENSFHELKETLNNTEEFIYSRNLETEKNLAPTVQKILGSGTGVEGFIFLRNRSKEFRDLQGVELHYWANDEKSEIREIAQKLSKELKRFLDIFTQKKSSHEFTFIPIENSRFYWVLTPQASIDNGVFITVWDPIDFFLSSMKKKKITLSSVAPFNGNQTKFINRVQSILTLPDLDQQWELTARAEGFPKPLRKGSMIPFILALFANVSYIMLLFLKSKKEKVIKTVVQKTEGIGAEERLQLMSDLSREIRIPMASIIGLNHLLLNSSLNAEQRLSINLMLDAGKVLMGSTRHILDSMMLNMGEIKPKSEEVNVRALIKEELEYWVYQAREKNIELIFDYPYSIPSTFLSDESILRCIINCALSNAIKFTSDGNVRIQIRKGKGDGLNIQIQDTGIGIDPSRMENLFDEKSEAYQETVKLYGGKGQSLSQCHKLLRTIQGNIQVHSIQDEGCRVEIEIPLSILKQNIDKRQKIPELIDRRVLIIDACEEAAYVLKNLCMDLGILAEETNNPMIALKMMRKAVANDQPYDFVMIDYHTNGSVGKGLAGMIQANQKLCSSFLVLTTAQSIYNLPDSMKNLGFSCVLTKPIDLDELSHHLLELINEKNSENSEFESSKIFKKSFSGYKPIIVADNNRMNRLTIKSMLQAQGCTVIEAKSGREVLEIIKNEKVSLILMSCSMPDIDGFEATRQIRESEHDISNRIPVIALTTENQKEHRDTCIQSGMDDFLNKPIEPLSLIAILNKWVLETKKINIVHPISFMTASKSEMLEAFKKDKILNQNTFKSICQKGQFKENESSIQFIHSLQELMTELHQAIKEQNKEDLVRLSHALKAACIFVGAERMGHIAKALEECAKEENFEQFVILMNMLEEHFVELESEFDTVTSPTI